MTVVLQQHVKSFDILYITRSIIFNQCNMLNLESNGYNLLLSERLKNFKNK